MPPSLPEELLDFIVGSLGPKDLCSTALVSRQFHRIALVHLYKNITVSSTQRLLRLTVSVLSDAALGKYAQECAIIQPVYSRYALRSAALPTWPAHPRLDELMRAATYGHSLDTAARDELFQDARHHIILGAITTIILPKFVNIHSLTLAVDGDIRHIERMFLMALERSRVPDSAPLFPNLSEVHLTQLSWNINCALIFKACFELPTMNKIWGDNIGSRQATENLQRLSYERLSVKHIKLINPALSVVHMVQQCDNLESFDLTHSRVRVPGIRWFSTVNDPVQQIRALIGSLKSHRTSLRSIGLDHFNISDWMWYFGGQNDEERVDFSMYTSLETLKVQQSMFFGRYNLREMYGASSADEGKLVREVIPYIARRLPTSLKTLVILLYRGPFLATWIREVILRKTDCFPQLEKLILEDPANESGRGVVTMGYEAFLAATATNADLDVEIRIIPRPG